MHKKLGLIGLAVGFAFAAGLSACGEGGEGGSTCTGDTDCGTGEICHPVAKQCVQTCDQASDCPDYAKTCEGVDVPTDGGTATGTKICKCSTDQICAGSLGETVVCSDEFKICMTKCGSNADCPAGYDCETGTGECKKAGAATCTPACTANQVCDTSGATPTCVAKCGQGTCTGGRICNFETGACETASSCAAANPQPDVCTYGQICQSSTCAEVPKTTCANFGNTHTDPWGAGFTGAIVYELSKFQYQAAAAFCGGTNNRYKAKISAYDPQGRLAAGTCTDPGETRGSEEIAMEALFHFVDPNGNEISPKPFIQCVNTTNGGKNTTFYVNFCSSTATGYSAGIHFEGTGTTGSGNAYCATITAG
jgi:hypothetical protein